MGKNKSKNDDLIPFEGKTQELEETKRISRGFIKNNPKKSK